MSRVASEQQQCTQLQEVQHDVWDQQRELEPASRLAGSRGGCWMFASPLLYMSMFINLNNTECICFFK